MADTSQRCGKSVLGNHHPDHASPVELLFHQEIRALSNAYPIQDSLEIINNVYMLSIVECRTKSVA